jgi:hypothetical protein
VPYDQTAERRSNHQTDLFPGRRTGKHPSQFAPESFRVLRMLEDERRLQIAAAVEPAREPEVASQIRARLLK